MDCCAYFCISLDVKEKNEGGSYRGEREILFTPKVKKNRGKREALKEKAKKYIQGLFLLLLLHFRVLNNNTHNLTEEGKKEEKVEEKGGAL